MHRRPLDLIRLVGKLEQAVCGDLNEARQETGPTGLVTGTDSGAIVAMEVFVEQDQISPIRVLLELFATAIDGSRAILAGEDADQSLCELGADLLQVQELAGTCRALHLEIGVVFLDFAVIALGIGEAE